MPEFSVAQSATWTALKAKIQSAHDTYASCRTAYYESKGQPSAGYPFEVKSVFDMVEGSELAYITMMNFECYYAALLEVQPLAEHSRSTFTGSNKELLLNFARSHAHLTNVFGTIVAYFQEDVLPTSMGLSMESSQGLGVLPKHAEWERYAAQTRAKGLHKQSLQNAILAKQILEETNSSQSITNRIQALNMERTLLTVNGLYGDTGHASKDPTSGIEVPKRKVL